MNTNVRQATVYRMVADDHFFPYGLKATHLLKREGFEVEDNRYSRCGVGVQGGVYR